MGRSSRRRLPRGLYVITDGRSRPLPALRRRAVAVLEGGAHVLQYRDKSGDSARRLREAEVLAEVCREAGATFIVNDDVALALAVAADGVHLGRDDDDIAAARAILGPTPLIGVSCYDSLERAAILHDAGADYLAFGAVYPSPTKPDAVRVSMATLAEARRRFSVALVAIGGIRPENAAAVSALGVDALAVVSAVFSADDPAAAAAQMRLTFDEGVRRWSDECGRSGWYTDGQ